MTAKFGAVFWGWGGVVYAPETGHGMGGQGGDARRAGVDDDAADRLAALGAAEAIASLDLPNGAVQMPDIETSPFPGPVAEAFYWDDSDVVGIVGPVGSGKTTTLLKSRLRRAVMMPRSTKDLDDDGRGWRRYKLLVIRATYRQLWSTTIPSYLESYPKAMGAWSGGRGDPVTHVIQFEDENGPIEFRVEFMAFGDDIIASMRGVQTTDIWLSETDTNPVEVLTTGIGRIDRWPGLSHFAGYPLHMQGYGQIVCDFNAPDEENWTYAVFYNEAERKKIADVMNGAMQAAALEKGLPASAARVAAISFYQQPGYGEVGCENLQNLSPGYYPRQIAAMKLAGRGDMIDRLVYNKITYLRAGDPVFKREFNRRIHVSGEPLAAEAGEELLIGLDQGFKGAAVIAQFLPPFQWRILAELHFKDERLFAAEFGRRLRDLLDTRFPGFRVGLAYGDVAGESGAAQAEENANWNRAVAKAANIRVRPQRIGANRIGPRLEAVRAALEFIHAGQPGLLIDPSCKFLIAGFEARYVWTDEIDTSGDKRKVPDKRLTEANVMDALQYLLLSKSRGDGLSPASFPDGKAALMGHNGGPRMGRSEPASGLIIGHSIFDI